MLQRYRKGWEDCKEEEEKRMETERVEFKSISASVNGLKANAWCLHWDLASPSHLNNGRTASPLETCSTCSSTWRWARQTLSSLAQTWVFQSSYHSPRSLALSILTLPPSPPLTFLYILMCWEHGPRLPIFIASYRAFDAEEAMMDRYTEGPSVMGLQCGGSKTLNPTGK